MRLRRIFTLNLLFVAGMLALSIWAWVQLPADARIATRFDFDGSPIAYMNKLGGLLLLPLMTFSIALVDLILPRIEPNRDNLKRSGKAYAVFSAGIVIFFSIVHVAIVLSALEQAVDIPTIITLTLGGFLIVTGNYLSKIRRNYSFGLRTPWTLSSDLAWNKTHRWAGWFTVVHGVALMVTSVRSHTILPVIVLISFVIVSIVILPVYSYLLWKSDSNRIAE
ncbi:MAG: SdpI family protein [Pleurocapsa sp. MO_226.B13]|nr:SdpI family protein [Pleurocapsa sp. MO_226.B13]